MDPTAEALGPRETQETEGNGALLGWTPARGCSLPGWAEGDDTEGGLQGDWSENFSVACE